MFYMKWWMIGISTLFLVWPLTTHTTEDYELKDSKFDPDTKNYILNLSGENSSYYNKAVNVKNDSLFVWDNCKVVKRWSTSGKEVFPSMWYLNSNGIQMRKYGNTNQYYVLWLMLIRECLGSY